METPDARPIRRRITDALVRLIAIADHPEDDEETRRRKRVGVGAGYLTIVAPLTLPIQAGGRQSPSFSRLGSRCTAS